MELCFVSSASTTPATWRNVWYGRSPICTVSRSSSHGDSVRTARARILPRATATAEPGQPPNSSGLKVLLEKPTKWREIPFASLQEELDAIDNYVKEENIQDNDPWANLLRGAAYEHWGDAAPALSHYGMCDGTRQIRIVPEFWLRKAYNAFKVGDTAMAHQFHAKAGLVNIQAVGNKRRFTFWNDDDGRDFQPKHNGPCYSLQHGVCSYVAGEPDIARENIAPVLLIGENDLGDLDHAAIWYLAASSRFRASGDLKVSYDSDVELTRRAVVGLLPSPALKPILPLFQEGNSMLEDAQNAALENDLDNGVTVLRCFYIGLYYDAVVKDMATRDEWLDRALAAGRGASTSDIADFMYYAAQNLRKCPVAL